MLLWENDLCPYLWGADSFLLSAQACWTLQVEWSLDQTGTSHMQDEKRRWHKVFIDERGAPNKTQI